MRVARGGKGGLCMDEPCPPCNGKGIIVVNQPPKRADKRLDFELTVLTVQVVVTVQVGRESADVALNVFLHKEGLQTNSPSLLRRCL
jgi:hypothetical protein